MIRFVLGLLSLLVVTAAFADDTTSAAPETTTPRLRSVPSFAFGERLPEWHVGVQAPAFYAPPPPADEAPATISLKTFRPLPMDELFRPRRVELSRFACTMKGVGAGAKLGLLAGLLGQEFGKIRNERVPWYMAGAGAAAGALLGGTLGAESSSWNVGVEWKEDPFAGGNEP